MKVHRLLSIVMHLLSRKRMGAQELADLFEVSLRTIYRDLETINGSGIPIVSYSGPSGGYEIMEQYRIDRQIVTLEDLNAIMTALKGLKASLDEPEIGSLLVKVGALIAKSEQHQLEETGETILFDTNIWRSRHIDKAMVTELRSAAKNRFIVSFSYFTSEGTSEERKVEPIGLAWKGYAWYLYAFCQLRNDYRTFRLTRVRELRVLLETFKNRGVGLEELNGRWGNQNAIHPTSMKLRFHPRMRVKVEEYFPQEEISMAGDGYLMVNTLHNEDNWLYSTLLSYGTDVVVLSPLHVAENLKERAMQVFNLYYGEHKLTGNPIEEEKNSSRV